MSSTDQPKKKSPLFSGHVLPSGDCNAGCCKMGINWIFHHLTLDQYPEGPEQHNVNEYAWGPTMASILRQAKTVQALGLAPWAELQPRVQRRLTKWSPVAKELWESEFVELREAVVRAWIWHYLDDNLFSFSGGDEDAGELVSTSSPAWDCVRGLRRHLHALRTVDTNLTHDYMYCIQTHFWNRMTEHLLRCGLKFPDFTTGAQLLPHYKQSLRLLIAGGKDKIPDSRGKLDLDWANTHDDFERDIKYLLTMALNLQRYVHGMHGLGSWSFRFTPIGSDKLWGFPFDVSSMRREDYPHIPGVPAANLPPDGGQPGDVQLVCEPMLVISGEDGCSYHKVSTVWTRMSVIDGFTFGGDEAEQQACALPGPSEAREEGEGQDDGPPRVTRGEEEADEEQESVVTSLAMARSPKRAQEETTTPDESAEKVKRIKTTHDGLDTEQEGATQATEQQGGGSPISSAATSVAAVRPKEGEGRESESKEADGKEADGKEVEGKEAYGKEVQGKELEGKEVEGKEVEGKEAEGIQVVGDDGAGEEGNVSAEEMA